MKTVQEMKYRIINPKEFDENFFVCGCEFFGDWGFELNGERSKRGYVSRRGAENALGKAIDKLLK